MSKLKVDTNKYNELVSNFSTCVEAVNDNVETFFDNVINTSGWEGEAASLYKEKATVDKVKYTNFGNSLTKFVDTLYAIGSEIESVSAAEK